MGVKYCLNCEEDNLKCKNQKLISLCEELIDKQEHNSNCSIQEYIEYQRRLFVIKTGL